MSKMLDSIRSSSSFAENYTNGMAFLFTSGIFNILKEFGRVFVVRDDSINSQAFEAARSFGYNQCLDDLMFFREKYVDEHKIPDLRPEFGGLDCAVGRGDITEGERNAIRQGEYKSAIGTNCTPSASK